MTNHMDTEALQALVGDLRQYHFDKEADVMEALAAEVLELRAERDAIAAAAFGYAIEAVRGENKRCLDLASIRIPAMASELEAALRKATPADAKAALDRMIEAAVKTATAQGDRA